MPSRFPNRTEPEVPSIAFQANMIATSLECQRDLRRYVVAFARTAATAHPSLVSGPSPPGLAVIAARLLPPAQSLVLVRPDSSRPDVGDAPPFRQVRTPVLLPPRSETGAQPTPPSRPVGERLLREPKNPAPLSCHGHSSQV